MMGVGAQDPPALSKHMDGSAALIFASGSTDRAMYTPENGRECPFYSDISLALRQLRRASIERVVAKGIEKRERIHADRELLQGSARAL